MQNGLDRSATVRDRRQHCMPPVSLSRERGRNVGIIASEENQVPVITGVAVVEDNYKRRAVRAVAYPVRQPSYKIGAIACNKSRHVRLERAAGAVAPTIGRGISKRNARHRVTV